MRRIDVKDQLGNVIDESCDASGSLTSRAVSTLPWGFAGAVRRIDTAHDNLGRREMVTPYDAATSGSIVDEVAFSDDGWGNVQIFEQDRVSAVGASGSVNDYEVSCSYEKATGGRPARSRCPGRMRGAPLQTNWHTTPGGAKE